MTKVETTVGKALFAQSNIAQAQALRVMVRARAHRPLTGGRPIRYACPA
jgi:hypothetical protein